MAQTLFKSARQHFYQLYSSLWGELSWKKSLLVICKILGLVLNTVTADDKYSLLSKDNLTQQIQMQLAKKKSLFICFGIFEICIKFWIFLKTEWLSWLLYTRTYGLQKTWLEKCLKSPVSEDPLTRYMVNGLKNSWNLKTRT